MELYEVWNQLDSLACHCRSMIEKPGDIWSEDLEACRIAQAIISEIMEERMKMTDKLWNDFRESLEKWKLN